MKVRVEISLQLRDVHGDVEEFCDDFQRSFAGSCGVQQSEISFRRIKTHSGTGTVSLLCDLNSADAMASALRMGETIREPLRNPNASSKHQSPYRCAVFRIWIKHRNNISTTRASVKSELHGLVSVTFREIFVESQVDKDAFRDTDTSLMVDSYVLELSIEKHEPIIIMPKKCHFQCVVVPIQSISNKLCVDTGCQTERRVIDSGVISAFSGHVSEARISAPFDFRPPEEEPVVESLNSGTSHTKMELNDGLQSPVSIRPIRKQRRNLWDDDG